MKMWIDRPFWKVCWLAAWIPPFFWQLPSRDGWDLAGVGLLLAAVLAMVPLGRTAATHLDR